MKKAIKILLVYFVYLLLTICFGTVFYMAFLGVVNATAGHKVVFWNQELFIKTFFFIAVCSLSLICPFLISYRIRHRSGFLQTIVYIIVCVINWGILFPIAITQADKAGYEEISVEKRMNSANYFRDSGKEIYYFTEDLIEDGKPVPSIVISPQKDYAVEYREISADKNFVLFKNAAPYNDIFTKKAFSNDFIFTYIDTRILLKNAVSCLEKGWSFWLGFLSIALVISSLYGLSNLFDWKLLDTALVIIMYVLILICNTYYYSDGFLPIKLKYLSGGFFTTLGRFVDNPALVLLNLSASLLFIVIGLINFFIKRKSVEE